MPKSHTGVLLGNIDNWGSRVRFPARITRLKFAMMNVLSWPRLRGVYPWDDREFPDDGKTVIIRRAMREKSDLEIEYFTYSRNTLTHRRVTPLEIEADTKLRAL